MSVTFLTAAGEELDLRVSCQNLLVLLDLLQLGFDYCGTISADRLLQKVVAARKVMDTRGCEFVRFPTIMFGSKGVKLIDRGLSSEHIGFYLDSLEQLAKAAQTAGANAVNWI